MKNLIVNADGYGFTYGVNRGIEAAIEGGIVRSISVNANFNAAEELRGFVERFPSVSVGVHLNPAVGPPLSNPREIPSLLDASGRFYGPEFTPRLLSGRIRKGELEVELSRQIERVRDLGITISHLDSHQNRHLYPPFFFVFLRLMDRYGIACMRTHAHFARAELPASERRLIPFYASNPHRFLTHTLARMEMGLARRRGAFMADRLMSTSQTGDKADQAKWLQLLRNVPPGWTEVYCHPALPDDELYRWASYVEPREREVAVMTSGLTRAEVDEQGIALRSFHDLARFRQNPAPKRRHVLDAE
jgi:predicted glycoside hydrolase/deacetylase ChbG (UPF0249 family)